jgi:hypothetical protein
MVIMKGMSHSSTQGQRTGRAIRCNLFPTPIPVKKDFRCYPSCKPQVTFCHQGLYFFFEPEKTVNGKRY